MSNKRVSQLVELTAAQAQLGDFFLIIDSSAKESKKMSASELSAFLGGSGSLFAIHADNADTASYVLASSVVGIISSASFAAFANSASSALWSLNALSSSYSKTASFALNSTNTGSTSASFLIYTGGNNGTSSFSISSSHSQGSDASLFLVYTGGNNGTASHAITTDNVNHATTADTASYVANSSSISTASFANNAAHADSSSFSNTTNLLNYSGTPNGTASFAVSAGSYGGIKPYGIFLANTQSNREAQLDSVSITSLLNHTSSTSIEAMGTLLVSYTSSVPLNESLSLVIVDRNLGNRQTLDFTPVSINMTPIIDNWDNYNSGTISMTYSLIGQSSLTGSFLVYVTSSSDNVKLASSRTTRFNIDSAADAVSSNVAEPIQFVVEPTSSVILTFTSTDGGPFTDLLPGFNSTASNKILTLSVNSQSVTSVRYVWDLPSLTSFDCGNNPSIMTLTGMPSTLTTLSCSNCLIASISSISNTTMSYFDCSNNNLTSLPQLSATMSYIKCSNNPLTSLPTLPNGLTKFYCDSTLISALPTIPDTVVSMSVASNSNFTIFNVFLPTSLVVFSCNNSPVQLLPTIPSGTLYLSASTCNLSLGAMDNICSNLVTNGLFSGSLDISGNGMPEPSTITNIITLLSRNWTVAYDL